MVLFLFFVVVVFFRKPNVIFFICNKKDSTSGYAVLAGLELYLYFWSYHLFELVAV